STGCHSPEFVGHPFAGCHSLLTDLVGHPFTGCRRQRRTLMTPSKVTALRSGEAAAQGRQAEAALVERCRRGDFGAFEELYRTHSGKLYGLIFRMVGNPADAEDLLQEVFLSAYRKLDGFR